MSPLNGFQRGYQTFFIFAVSVFSFFAFHHASLSVGGSQHSLTPTSHQSSHVVKKVGVPFGHDQPHNFSSTAPGIIVPARIEKRALSFFDAVCKGEKHLFNIARAALLGTEPGNRYTVQDIEDAGWSIDDTFPLRIPNAMRPALESFGIGTEPDTMKLRFATQDKDYTGKGGQPQESTQGQYYQIYNPAGKAIVCPDNASPAHFLNMMRQARELEPIPEDTKEFQDALPKINRWNDVVWAIWADTAGSSAGDLQYIFRDNIVNDDTKGVIEAAVAPLEMKNLPWPGKTFGTDELGGQALLGTPHGAGIAWMLIENMKILGKRNNIEITVYSGKADEGDKYYYYMLFNLKR